jgi:hypothetical protein
MAASMSRWSVDVYYSGFTNVVVEVTDIVDAIDKGREEAQRRLGLAQILDPEGAMAELVGSLEPWEECDTAEMLS